MLDRADIVHLTHRHRLFQIELDSRHLALINDVFQLGVNTGINQAKEAICWRINGAMWCNFIDEERENELSTILGKD